MSNLTRIDLYKPEILTFEMQYFSNSYVCWFSGPYYTLKKQFSNRLPIELLKKRLSFTQSIPTVGSNFYQTHRTSNLRARTKSLSLMHVYLKQWIIGSGVGFKNSLRVRGVGYKFNVSSTQLKIQAGYSHLLRAKIPFVKSINSNKKSTLIRVKSNNLVNLTNFLSTVRNLRKPDVYKGKGIRYKKDFVMKKEGKKKKTN